MSKINSINFALELTGVSAIARELTDVCSVGPILNKANVSSVNSTGFCLLTPANFC